MAAPAVVLRPVSAAEVLGVRLEGMEIPLALEQLDAWSRGERPPAPAGSDLAVWLDLLEPTTRKDLAQLLRSPLLRDRSFGRQLLDSWAGGQLLAEVGSLLTTSDGAPTTSQLQMTLRRLLEQRRDVTALDLLRALPEPRVSLQLDGLISLAERWRRQLREQRSALRRLQSMPLRRKDSAPLAVEGIEMAGPRREFLAVAHRQEPLPLEIWTPTAPGAGLPLVVMMPGLGGNAEQLGWLAGALAGRGWPVVVIQHPGSDAAALRAALEGLRPPPGAETLADRLADVEAVLAARRSGGLPVAGQGVVLLGHSLGGVTALLASGLPPEPGLEQRCRRALERLPISNPSRLLQCQLPSTRLPRVSRRPEGLRGVVLLNSFGSLLWPGSGLRPLPVPALLVGGSLDLVTPPLEEQLDLFLPPGNPRSRLVVVAGGSHFSPVRMSAREEVLFRLGDDLVGVDPASVQSLLLRLTTEFLQSLGEPESLPSQRRRQGGVTAYVLDPDSAGLWNRRLGR